MSTPISADARSASVRVAVIAAGTAEPVAQIVRTLPAHSGLALVMLCDAQAEAAGALRPASAFPITEARGRIRLEPNRVFVIPAGCEGAFHRDELVVMQAGEPRAPVDKLLRSLADEHGGQGIAVLLEGRNNDGVLGIKRLKEAGGLTIAQAPEGGDDEPPRPATGVIEMVDLVLPLSEIGERLAALGRDPGGDEPPDGGAAGDHTTLRGPDGIADTLHEILVLVRIRSGHDFGSYKRATLYRRVARRIQVCQCASIAAYHQYLREHPDETAYLLRDFLISVTNFFRDRAAFEALAGMVVPRLFSGKPAGEKLRVWVAGCATGEEAYSIAILLYEHASKLRDPPQLQIFATDIDEDALAEARAGRYPGTIDVDVSPERLQRFFAMDGDHYRVGKALREIMLFSPHNVLRDPPFSRLDLISCRNLLIYLNRDAQDRVLNGFHFGLRPDGYLLLGASESAENTAMFSGLDAKHRLFVRRPNASRLTGDAIVANGRWVPPSLTPTPPPPPVERPAVGQLHHQLQASNEELRSATEELETSKEELQSVNEELITLNQELKLKVDEVSHANSDLQNLMTSTDLGVVFLDRALNIKRFTPRVQDLINVIPSDVGRPLAHLTHRLETDELPQLAQSVLQTLRTIEREVQSRDGRRYLARMLPYRSLEDRIGGVVLTFVDVSDLRDAVDARRRSEAALHASEQRLRFALRTTPILVVSLDDQLHATWGYVLGQELELHETGAAPFLELLAPGHADRFTAIVRQVLRDHGGQRAELDLTIEGEARTYDFRIERDELGVNAVGFDITPSKLAEAALRDADRRKDEFLATLSHELRNPLTPLKVALDIAKLAGGDPPQLERALGIMERQVAQLSQLVDELLDLSRITQGRIEIERTALDPVQVVEAALEATRPLFQQRDHQIAIELPETPCRVLGDHARLTQVLSNLLDNAAKYTPRGGHIALALAVDRARNVLAIRVRDDGDGIAPELLPRIFEIFVQSRDAAGRSLGGLGIGLNLVRRLVELHGGTVSASSAGPGRGSEFVVELPLVAGKDPQR